MLRCGKDFERNTLISHILPQNYVPLNLEIDWLIRYCKEDINALRTMDGDGRQSIIISHLSKSIQGT